MRTFPTLEDVIAQLARVVAWWHREPYRLDTDLHRYGK